MDVRLALWVATVGVLGGEMLVAWSLATSWLVVPAAVGGAVYWLAMPARRRTGALLVLLPVAFGAARMQTATSPFLPWCDVARLTLPRRTILTGRIVAAPERRPGRTILLVEAEALGRGEERRAGCGVVRLAVRRPARRWAYGDRLAASVTLRMPRNFENPGRFDYVGHLARQGVRVTAFAWRGDDLTRLPGHARGLRAALERWRERIDATIRAAVPSAAGAVLRALIVGDEEGIDDGLRDAFTRAGVVHVLSISGLHVGLVAAAGFALARRMLARSERLLLRADVDRLAAAASLAPVAFYAAIAGLGVATLRSAIMIAAVVVAGLVGRRPDVLRTLAVAAIVLATLWPGTPLEIAFQLSFASVVAIVCGTRRLETSVPGRSWWARMRSAALVSPCALVGTAPLTAFHFHQVSLVAVVANPITLPIFGSVVVIIGLCGAAVVPVSGEAAAVLFRVAGLVLRPGIAVVSALAAPGWAAVDVPIPSVLEVILLYGLLVGLVLLPRPAARALVIGTLVALLADAAFWVHERFASGMLRVTFLDVGQGDAAVAELPGGGVIVVDAGGFPGGDFDTGAAIVGPFLWSRKILHVDAVAMTHAHPDHSGGVPYLLSHHHAREFWWTGVPGDGVEWERLQATLAATATSARVLAQGAALPAFAVGAEVLHPPRDASRMSLNDSSLTLRLGLGDVRILLTGDIEAWAETRLLDDPPHLTAEIIKVPHHGSRTSSTPRFLDAVNPQIAIISAGADNRYHLPSPDVEARYRARNICLLRTDHCGAISAQTNGKTLTISTTRGCTCPQISDARTAGEPKPH